MADTPAILRSYRDRKLIASLSELIRRRSRKDVRIMEVCGGHTNAIQRFGLPYLLPPTIRLISGPGCPVCVTPARYIDEAASASLERGVTIVTFGDLIRVPGSETSVAVMGLPFRRTEISAGFPIRRVRYSSASGQFR